MPQFMEDLLTLLEGKQTTEARLTAFYAWIVDGGTVLSDEEFVLAIDFCSSLDRTNIDAFYGI